MRNPSKNTIKKIMRRAFNAWILEEQNAWNPEDLDNYFLYNQIGAALYRMSKDKICNIGVKGFEKYLTPLMRKKYAEHRNRLGNH